MTLHFLRGSAGYSFLAGEDENPDPMVSKVRWHPLQVLAEGIAYASVEEKGGSSR